MPIVLADAYNTNEYANIRLIYAFFYEKLNMLMQKY